jgi:hypothetical protein
MKNALFVLTILSSFSIFAETYSTFPIVKETWSCKDSKGYNQIKVVVTDKLAAGTLNAEDKIDLKLKGQVGVGTISTKTVLVGGLTQGHDMYDYEINLVRNNGEIFSANSEDKKAKGQAVVFESGFIDCLGDFSEVKLLDCDIKLERKEVKE